LAESLEHLSYYAWVNAEAAAINSDGCTLVAEIYSWCCRQHDLAYYYARDPVDAYLCYVSGQKDYWKNAAIFNQAQCDAQFRNCIRDKSAFHGFSVIAFIRWAGLRLAGRFAWNNHRKLGHGTYPEAG
jgi:hypothetical protein